MVLFILILRSCILYFLNVHLYCGNIIHSMNAGGMDPMIPNHSSNVIMLRSHKRGQYNKTTISRLPPTIASPHNI